MRTWEDYKAHVKAQGKGEKENMNKLFQGGMGECKIKCVSSLRDSLCTLFLCKSAVD